MNFPPSRENIGTLNLLQLREPQEKKYVQEISARGFRILMYKIKGHLLCIYIMSNESFYRHMRRLELTRLRRHPSLQGTGLMSAALPE